MPLRVPETNKMIVLPLYINTTCEWSAEILISIYVQTTVSLSYGYDTINVNLWNKSMPPWIDSSSHTIATGDIDIDVFHTKNTKQFISSNNILILMFISINNTNITVVHKDLSNYRTYHILLFWRSCCLLQVRHL